MRKLLLALSLLALAFSFVACGSKETNEIKVGILRPEIYAGEMVEKGILMAIEEVNAQGGILGKKVVPVIINDENKPDIGKLNLRKAIESDNIDFILGGMNSAVVLTAMDVMAEYKKIWIGSGGASPQVIQNIVKDYNKYKYYFRAGTIDAAKQGEAGADLIINYMGPKFGIKKVALVGADQNYSKFILGTTKKKLEAAGFEVVYENYLPTSTTDFSPVFSQIKDKGARIVFEAWPSAEAITFVKQFNANKVPAILLGAVIEALKDEWYTETGGACAYQSGFSPQSGPAPMTDKTLAFAESFKKKFGKSAGYIAYPSYDSVYILKAAIEQAGTYSDTDKLIKTLEGIDYKGTIWYNFIDDSHDLTMGIKDGKMYADFVWFQWMTDGSRKAFYPEEFKQIDYQVAPWALETFKKEGLIK